MSLTLSLGGREERERERERKRREKEMGLLRRKPTRPDLQRKENIRGIRGIAQHKILVTPILFDFIRMQRLYRISASQRIQLRTFLTLVPAWILPDPLWETESLC